MIDNVKLPKPTEQECHYTNKFWYIQRMFREELPKYKLDGLQFSDWASRTFNKYYQENKHITYKESKKID